MKKLFLSLLLLSSVLSVWANSQYGVVYVKPGGAGNKDGSSWDHATDDIQTAINLAKDHKALDGVTPNQQDVWVAGSMALPATAAIVLADQVNLYGGFMGTETSLSQRVRPDEAKPWEFSYPSVLTANGYRHFEAGGAMSVIVDGFTFMGGNAAGKQLNGAGGAMVLRQDITVKNCIFAENKAEGAAPSGGAITATGGQVINCYFRNNACLLPSGATTGGNGGGAIHSNPTSDVLIEGCVFDSNQANLRGGAINFQGSFKTTVSNCQFFNNQAMNGVTFNAGGAIYNSGDYGVVSNCLFYNNSGVTTLYMRCPVINNTIVNNVGGLYVAVVTKSKVFNNLIWGNVTKDGAATGFSQVAGNFPVDNNAWYIAGFGSPANTSVGLNNLSFPSNISNGDYPEAPVEKLQSGPKFIYPSRFVGAVNSTQPLGAERLDSMRRGEYNFRLTSASPLKNRGSVAHYTTIGSQTPDQDLSGGMRLAQSNVEMGAYEINRFMVSVDYNQTEGSVQGVGSYDWNSDVTLTAVGASGKVFFGWLDTQGADVSSSASYTFKIQDDTALQCLFVDGGSTSVGYNQLVSFCYVADQVLRVTGEKPSWIELFSLQGELLHLQASSVNHEVAMNSGVYLLRIHTEEGVVTQKIVVK